MEWKGCSRRWMAVVVTAVGEKSCIGMDFAGCCLDR